jgi:hypothetical protein
VLFADLFGNDFSTVAHYLYRFEPISHSVYFDEPRPAIELNMRRLEDSIPFECLTLPGKLPEIEAPQDVVRAASKFLGFSFAINRVIRREQRELVLRNRPRLRVKLFCHDALVGARNEHDFFRERKAQFDLDGPWPQASEKPTTRDLVENLYWPDKGFSEAATPSFFDRPRDEVHHISCHTYADYENPSGGILELTNLRTTLEEMESEWIDIDYEAGRPRGREMPLVFFNACGGSHVAPKGITSFAHFFLLMNQNRGFIATETHIPDRFASEFSKQFYLHLLRGHGVSQALLRARRTLLVRYNNPLGILYTFYGDSHLRVEKPVDV